MRLVQRMVLALFLFLLLPIVAPVWAEEGASSNPTPQLTFDVTYEKVNPSDGFGYLRKRLGEKIRLFFYFSPTSKADYYKDLVNKRLAELKYVVEKREMNSFEKATTRYSTTVGIWTEYILSKGLTAKKEEAAKLLDAHGPVMEALMTKFDGATAEWRFVKQDFDYLKIYSSKLRD